MRSAVRRPYFNDFYFGELAAQRAWLSPRSDQMPAGHREYDFWLKDKLHNFDPAFAGAVVDYFERRDPPIAWHTAAGHLLSSQACCINFLAPFARRKDLLAELIGGVLKMAAPPEMIPMETFAGEDWYVAFEWIGPGNFLREWPRDDPPPPRGANVTSTDAAVSFKGDGGITEVILIEWKYTERYRGGLRDKRNAAGEGGNARRTSNYADRMRAPDGPIRADAPVQLNDFFFEPLYQLLRQQMLAWHWERSLRETKHPVRVRVLHLSPRGNLALHDVTSDGPAFAGKTDVFEAFTSVLEPPVDGEPRFIDRRIEDVFGPVLARHADEPWARYLVERYAFMRPAAPDTRNS